MASVPDEQRIWLKDASSSIKRNAFYLRKAMVRRSRLDRGRSGPAGQEMRG